MQSNMDMRNCYTKHQQRINAEADAYALNAAREFQKQAKDPEVIGISPASGEDIRKAGIAVANSQRSWRAYRDQHCSALEYSYTTGSGAGTAYEACMYFIGAARLEQLKADFPQPHSRPRSH
jgi:uncharacterized protein YecT (DUF1311 family)